jgi:S1-C subfamily serine protease
VAPGQIAAVTAWHNGREAQVHIRVGQEPEGAVVREPARRWLGLVVDGVTPETGAVVTEVQLSGPAGGAGVMRGDILRELDHHVIRTLADYEEAANGISPGQTALLLLQRGATSFYVVIDPDR